MKRILIGALLVLSLDAAPTLAGPILEQRLAAAQAKVAKLQSQLAKASAGECSHASAADRTTHRLPRSRRTPPAGVPAACYA